MDIVAWRIWPDGETAAVGHWSVEASDAANLRASDGPPKRDVKLAFYFGHIFRGRVRISMGGVTLPSWRHATFSTEKEPHLVQTTLSKRRGT